MAEASARENQASGKGITDPVSIRLPVRGFSIRRRAGFWRDALRRRMLAGADAIAVLSASVVTGVALDGDRSLVLGAALWLPVWLLLAKLHGLYDRDHRALRHLTADEFSSSVTWSTTGTAAFAAALALAPGGHLSPTEAIHLWATIVILTPALRAMARAVWRRMTPPERLVIVGSGSMEKATRRKFELYPDMHLELVATVDEHALSGVDDGGIEIGPLIARAGAPGPIERLVLAAQTVDEQLIAELVAYCRREKVKLTIVPPARGMFGTAVELNHVGDLPMVAYSTWDVPRSSIFLKRLLDIAISAAGLVLLLPVQATIAVLVRLDSPGPLLYVQRRAGLDGKPFRMFKFRTMTEDADRRLVELVKLDELPEPVFKLNPDPRVTRAGRWLRRWSLDELPQLVNVLRGEMSLVGPRPEQVELVRRYTPEQRIRLRVKPGMTGPMQVLGRAALCFDERLAVERDYVENLSLRRDMLILLMTGTAVLRGWGAS